MVSSSVNSWMHGTFNKWVLYVDLPNIGQVSFHSPERLAGPDYDGEWDGARLSAERIIRFSQMVYSVDPINQSSLNFDQMETV